MKIPFLSNNSPTRQKCTVIFCFKTIQVTVFKRNDNYNLVGTTVKYPSNSIVILKQNIISDITKPKNGKTTIT